MEKVVLIFAIGFVLGCAFWECIDVFKIVKQTGSAARALIGYWKQLRF